MCSQPIVRCLPTILLELPVSVVERADLAGLEPSGDAVEVEGVIADTPGNSAFLAGSRGLVCLTLNAEVHDVVPADGAVVDNNIPRPERDGVPLDSSAQVARHQPASCIPS
jgi:hypothetical protein